MQRGRLLLFASTFAAGAAGGYLLSEKDVLPHVAAGAAPDQPLLGNANVPVAPAPAPHEASPATPPPDMAGTTEITSAEIGGEASMKGRVAATASACLKKLSPAEQCDPKRVEACARDAVVNVCNGQAPPSP